MNFFKNSVFDKREKAKCNQLSLHIEVVQEIINYKK